MEFLFLKTGTMIFLSEFPINTSRKQCSGLD
jgi:hypothetical protein